jgi:hypothetical protein
MENALEDVTLVVGTQQNLSNLYSLDIYGLNIELIRNLWFENFFFRMEIINDGIE